MWELSFQNLNMLLATIPSMDDEDDEKEEKIKEVESTDELAQFLGL